jgi:hypothetical protein
MPRAPGAAPDRLSHRGAPEVARLYAGDLDVRAPLVSPLFGSLEGLAPLAVFTGTRDILNTDAHQLKAKAARARIPLAWFEYPGMLHVWPLFPIPEAKRAIRQIAAFVLAEPVTDCPGQPQKHNRANLALFRTDAMRHHLAPIRLGDHPRSSSQRTHDNCSTPAFTFTMSSARGPCGPVGRWGCDQAG